MSNLINFGLFYAVWFAAVKGAATGFLWLGPIVMSAAFVIHIYQSSSKKADIILAIICLFLGAIIESSISATGLVHFAGYTKASILAPAWVLALWVNISITINHSLSWLKDRLLLSSCLAAISGPLSYVGGVNIGAASVENFWIFIAVYGLIWGLIMPVVFFVAK